MVSFVPPNNKSYERIVLGSILTDPTILRKCALTPENFYQPKHQKYFETLLQLQEKKSPIDLVTVHDALQKANLPEGAIELSECMSEVGSTVNFQHYAEQLLELSWKRDLQRVFLANLARVEELSVDEIISLLRKRISEIISGRSTELVSMKDLSHKVYDFVESRHRHVDKMSGIPSGLKDLDYYTDGFQNGDLIIIAGRPGSGKSALAVHIAQHASSLGTPVGVVSLEMGEIQIGIRSLASLSAVEMRRLQKGDLRESDWSRLSAGAGKMSTLPIWFSFATMEMRAISKVITAMIEEKGCRIIFLDYLQLARVKGIQQREREVASISGMLKSIAKIYKIPVVPLAQLNRDPEKENRKPRLSDLRESGAIEQDADVVIFMHPDTENEGIVEIIVGKGRNIGTGSCKVVWDRKMMTYRDLTTIPE